MVSAAYEAGSAIEVTMAGPGSGRMGLTINQTVKSPIIVVMEFMPKRCWRGSGAGLNSAKC
jgi:hypothetical protein